MLQYITVEFSQKINNNFSKHSLPTPYTLNKIKMRGIVYNGGKNNISL